MESQTHARGGRPSKYRDEYPDKLLEYFEEYLSNPHTQEIIERTVKFYANGTEKERFEKFKTVSRNVPTLFGFARSIGVNYETARRWNTLRIGKKPSDGEKDSRPYRYPEFCGAYKQAIHFQTEFILGAGMSGRTPPAFAIFAAKNMVGWRDDATSRFIDKDGKDRVAPGYVLLPTRKTEAEVEEESAAEGEGV